MKTTLKPQMSQQIGITPQLLQSIRLLQLDGLQLELEVRYQFWKRFSAVVFGGYGEVWNDEDAFQRKLGVGAGGLGFRYELARKYQMHMGIDVGYGPDGPAVIRQPDGS